MQIRDFISHEWQTVGSIQAELVKAGIPIPEVVLIRQLRNMPCVIEQDGKFRQVAHTEDVS